MRGARTPAPALKRGRVLLGGLGLAVALGSALPAARALVFAGGASTGRSVTSARLQGVSCSSARPPSTGQVV